MKWIRFDDMKPPFNMYVFVTYADRWSHNGYINIIRWEKKYETEPNWEYIDVCNNLGSYPKQAYKLLCWAPLSFFDEYMPACDPEDSQMLLKSQDWYLQHKDNPLFSDLIKMDSELKSMTKQELDKKVETERTTLGMSIKSSGPFYYYQQQKMNDLLEEIEFPGRKEATDEHDKEVLEMSAKMMSEAFKDIKLDIPMPKFVEKLSKLDGKSKTKGKTLRMLKEERDSKKE